MNKPDPLVKGDIATAWLCDNLMKGLDPFAGFPNGDGANAASGTGPVGLRPEPASSLGHSATTTFAGEKA